MVHTGCCNLGCSSVRQSDAVLSYCDLLLTRYLAQDAEWFEAKQSKRKGGGQSNGMPARQAPTELTKDEEFEVSS